MEFITCSLNRSFPEYDTYKKRLESFTNSPPLIRSRQHLFADAGFFYTGVKDCTICFFCGGGLKNWALNDDPWMAHAKWFHKCPFILLNKGLIFVNQCSATN